MQSGWWKTGARRITSGHPHHHHHRQTPKTGKKEKKEGDNFLASFVFDFFFFVRKLFFFGERLLKDKIRSTSNVEVIAYLSLSEEKKHFGTN
jgi:hypothetical protein